MVRPVAFNYNAETAVNNAFQHETGTKEVQEQALKEFDDFVAVLKQNRVNVNVEEDTAQPNTPDSIFPNNWVSFHQDGTVVLYPMFAENRRRERESDILIHLEKKFFIRSVMDLTQYEKKQQFLEGTGSMILDRNYEIAYACISPRTSATVLYDFCDSMGYTPVLFNAVDKSGREIYHTNVMMCLSEEYVVICMECVTNDLQKKLLKNKFLDTGKEIVEISFKQMLHFAGNMLQIENADGKKLLVMSTQAYHILSKKQIDKLETFNPIIHSSLNTIEQNGGGSARCMMAEIYLPLK